MTLEDITATHRRKAPTEGDASRQEPVGRVASHSGSAYIDAGGHRWEADRFYKGGEVRPGPAHLFPPAPDAGLFKTMRQAVSADLMVPQDQRAFQYDIPLVAGVYELRLYFADPLRQSDGDQKEDAQNVRLIDVELNGHPPTDRSRSGCRRRCRRSRRPGVQGCTTGQGRQTSSRVALAMAAARLRKRDPIDAGYARKVESDPDLRRSPVRFHRQ